MIKELTCIVTDGTDSGKPAATCRKKGDGNLDQRVDQADIDGWTAYNGKGGIQCVFRPSSLTTWAMDPLPWSPIELLPEAAALIFLAHKSRTGL